MTTSARSLLATLALAALVFGAVACSGGGGSKSGGSDEEIVTRAANDFVLTIFGLFSGSKKGQDLINAFAPECRQGVKASDLDAVVGLVRLFAPELSKVKIQEVDLGRMSITKRGDRYLAHPVDSSAARVKVDGKWINANDYFRQIGLDDADDIAGTDDLEFVIRDGRAYISDCSAIQDLTGF